MTTARAPGEILAERLRVVLALTEANAAHRLAQSRAGAAEIDVMSLEQRATDAAAPDPEIEAELAAAHAIDTAARSKMSETEARIAALDAQLAALDRELAATDR